MIEAADPSLGRTLSTHRHSYTQRVLALAIGAVVAALGYVLAADVPGLGWTVAAVGVAIPALLCWAQTRESLGVYEHGLVLFRAGRRWRQVLWRELTQVSPHFSYHVHPDTLLKVKLRPGKG